MEKSRGVLEKGKVLGFHFFMSCGRFRGKNAFALAVRDLILSTDKYKNWDCVNGLQNTVPNLDSLSLSMTYSQPLFWKLNVEIQLEKLRWCGESFFFHVLRTFK